MNENTASATTTEPLWFKSTFSGNGGNCVEVATNLLAEIGEVLLRDSKHPEIPPFRFTEAEWDAFTRGAQQGQFNL